MEQSIKKAPSEATLGGKLDRRQKCRQKHNLIIACLVRFCIIFLALVGLCGLGALIEQGMLFGLVLALISAAICRMMAALLPEGGRENREADMVSLPCFWGADFVMRASGTDMEPDIKDGDQVAICRTEEVQNGRIAAVRIGDDVMLWRFYRQDDYILLRSASTCIVKSGEARGEIQVLGQVVGVLREFPR